MRDKHQGYKSKSANVGAENGKQGESESELYFVLFS
jgi:hypothetical protein